MKKQVSVLGKRTLLEEKAKKVIRSYFGGLAK